MLLSQTHPDDAAFASLCHNALQRSIDVMYRIYSSAGYMINVRKTEVPCQPSEPRYHDTDASFSTVGEHIKCVVNLPYLETELSSTLQ